MHLGPDNKSVDGKHAPFRILYQRSCFWVQMRLGTRKRHEGNVKPSEKNLLSPYGSIDVENLANFIKVESHFHLLLTAPLLVAIRVVTLSTARDDWMSCLKISWKGLP